MQITTAGESVIAKASGVVTQVSDDAISVGAKRYPLRKAPSTGAEPSTVRTVQVPAVHVGDRVVRKQILARGTTELRFEPGIVVFTFLVFVVGIAMGIGKAAVYKHIPDYFPGQVGVVGGLVG